ncbi:MAG: hypothetical protein WHT46_02840 [Candidatus Geothermincolales bacterium]
MGIFDGPLSEIRRFIDEGKTLGKISSFPPSAAGSPTEEPGEPSVILQEETALELGHPLAGSLFVLAWDEEPTEDHIHLLGPDLDQLPPGKCPFGMVVMVGGSFRDQYETYRDLRERIYQARLPGFMIRVFPGTQSIWCRVGRKALREGMDIRRLGSAIVASLRRNPSVEGVEVLFITSSAEDLGALSPPARLCSDITDALTKMYEEMNFDCESCEYVEVCEAVDGLREIRDRLLREGNRGEVGEG